MKKWGWVALLGLVMLACAVAQDVVQPAGLVEIQPVTEAATQQPLASATIEIWPTETQPALSLVPSGEASAYNGQWLIVRIERAYCSYHPDIDGQPTFCNDQPYPQHDFTLLVWEQDWSHLDGLCLLVRGQVELYQGKAEIIVDNPNQVSECE